MGFGGLFAGFRPAFDAGGAAVAALHVEDSFTAANGTNLHGRVPDVANTPGATWTAALQTWSIIDGCARGTDYLLSLAVIESGSADGVITMPSQRGGNQNGIIFRYVDNNNYFRAETSSGGGLVIAEYTAGARTVRAQAAEAGTTTYTMTLTLAGESMQLNFNGQTISYSSSVRVTATKHGIFRQDWINNGVAAWWKMV